MERIILVDMDDVIADFDRGFLDLYRAQNPDQFFVSLENRRNFRLKNDYPKDLRPLVEKVYFSKGFFLNLPPVEGSLEALSELKKEAKNVYICTSPFTENPFCLSEKWGWVENYLGHDWIERLIITRDKTMVHGDMLIDDRPNIRGIMKPSWEHILYSRPYNQDVEGKRRLTWQNWREVLDIV